MRVIRRVVNSRADYFFWFDDATTSKRPANVTANINASYTVISTTPFLMGMANHPWVPYSIASEYFSICGGYATTGNSISKNSWFNSQTSTFRGIPCKSVASHSICHFPAVPQFPLCTTQFPHNLYEWIKWKNHIWNIDIPDVEMYRI